MWCCLYPRNFDCCPVDPHAWKRDTKVCAHAPPLADAVGQKTNSCAICNIHGCNNHMLQRILLQNTDRHISNDSTQNIWNESVHVPLCENWEKYNFRASSNKKRRNAIHSLQPLMPTIKTDRELMKQLLKSHPAGYKYACKCDRTMTKNCECKRKSWEMHSSNYNGIYKRGTY